MTGITRRFDTCFLAWQSTTGYICHNISPDVILKMQVQSGQRLHWSATLTWGSHVEIVKDCKSLGEALNDLWRLVDHNHAIFSSQEDARRRPVGYTEHEALDVNTQDVLHRYIWITQSVFQKDWSLVIFYHPTEDSRSRVNMRLLAKENKLGVGSKGASLLDAARELFRKSIPLFAEYADYVNDNNERHGNS